MDIRNVSNVSSLMFHGLILFILTFFSSSQLYADNVTAKGSFNDWKTAFRSVALAKGISAETLDSVFNTLQVDPEIIQRDKNQAEFSKPVWKYLETAISDARLERGKALFQEHQPLFQHIYETYGVEPEYVLAIWGIESNYGSNLGSKSVIRSLATLAYDGRRKAFAEQQLLATLGIIERGDIKADELIGSWAGAIGHTQFIPTTYEAFAVDFDGDGRRDLVNSIPDALASAANYLAKSGWKTSQRWGEEITLPDNFLWELADLKTPMTLSCWQHSGVETNIAGEELAQGGQGAVLLPAGYQGPAFMVYDNFKVIKRYNNANSYALAVAYLGDQLAGRSGVRSAWPVNDQPLSRSDKTSLQKILTAAGFDTKGVDGLIGPNSRAAIRAWQKSMTIPADGYVNQERFLQLKRQYVEIVEALEQEERNIEDKGVSSNVNQ
jgi:membrane-bound lytic murein transglycosylase B